MISAAEARKISNVQAIYMNALENAILKSATLGEFKTICDIRPDFVDVICGILESNGYKTRVCDMKKDFHRIVICWHPNCDWE